MPIATGIRVGMGESPESWVEAVKIVNEVHKQYNNIMTFNVIPFVPEPFSVLSTSCPCSNDTLAQAIKTVRRHLAPGITLVAEGYKRLALAPDAVVSGAFDLGPIHIADNERFDLDMLNAVTHTRELLEKLSVTVGCTPVVRPPYDKEHRLPQAIETNLRRFDKLSECAGSELDTPASGQPVTVG